MLTWSGARPVLRGIWQGFALLTDRRRYAQWEAEWAVKEPGVSGRQQD
ncbi:hypothetical protein ACFY1P_08455 [Streptomyces sp. NPDC001407]